MRELQVMEAFKNSGTAHYDYVIGTKPDGTKLHYYYLTNMNDGIRKKLKQELAKIKGCVWFFGKA